MTIRSALSVSFVIAASMMIAGCGASDEGQGVGGVTAGEARALNEAAQMLDRQADNTQSALNVREEGDTEAE